MRIDQGVIKRVTSSFVWIEYEGGGYEKTGFPVQRPTMSLTMARPYVQFDVEQCESGQWNYVKHFFTEKAAAHYTARYQEKSGDECRYVPRERTD